MSKARQNPASRAPYTWTPELVEAVAKRHEAGAWLKHACALEGGTFDGLRDAMARVPAYADRIALAHARGAEKIRTELTTGDKLMGADWKREAWLLERWDRVEFAPPTQKLDAKQAVTGENGGPIQTMTVVVTEEQMLAAAGRKLESK